MFQKIKQILFPIIIGLVFLNPLVVLAQGATNTNTNTNNATYAGIEIPKYGGVEDSIAQFLCTPSEGAADGKDLERCINKMYRFGISFGGIALVFFLVFAGYMYIMGGESGKTKAKGIVQNALVGIAILLGTYVLLGFINPNLLIFKSIQPPIFNADDLPDCKALGFEENCIVQSATPGADFSTDSKFDGKYIACGKTFSDPNVEKNNVKSVSVKVWDISGGAKVTKNLKLQMNQCVIDRAKKAFDEYYAMSDKFPIKDLGGYSVRNIAGTDRWSAHSYGLTIDINHETNCHASNDGKCKSADWVYKPCPGVGCSPYSITESSGIYKALKANGFGWGGHWKTSKDYMHFSCTENEQGKCI